MTENKLGLATWHFITALTAAVLYFASLQTGCGATCDQIEKDRKSFLARKGSKKGTHAEVIVPFSVAEKILEPHVLAVNPVDVNIPGLGNLESYFGKLSVAPVRIKLKPASPNHIGFHLDFQVLSNGDKAFELYVETEVRPDLDLAAGKVTFGFTPEALEKAKPGVSREAKKELGAVIYSRIPSAAKIFISRSMAEAAAGTAVELLLSSFYPKAKDKILSKLAKISRVEFAIPDVPLASVVVTSADDGGGWLRLAIVTSLPVSAGIAEVPKISTETSQKNVTIRMSGSTVAELVNWAMAKGLVPNRYDGKGRAGKDGEFRPGLDWLQGDERPMKVYLWDLEKPCMRVTLSAKPSVKIADQSLEIRAGDIKTDDVEASAFTRIGAWFNLLWRDALKLQKKASAKTKIKLAGRELDVLVERASLEQDELTLQLSLSPKGG